ncbi:alanine:cation symporter family protein [Clostridiaceae bacterium M8S5]|nr:alanine:cation symporter family protein [Clostridiaceae bacterium M8S5]
MFLPIVILAGIFIIYRTFEYRNKISKADKNRWYWSKIRNSIAISLSSKIGTGAIIGVLAAMFKMSNNGVGGESIVLWILLGMLILVPITYCEVLFSRITKRKPREFISYNLNEKSGYVYSVSLVVLYTFGFVGFQLTGIQSVIKNIAKVSLDYEFTNTSSALYIVLPLIIVVSLIVITKNHELFIKTLASMIGLVIASYVLLFIVFVIKTNDFIPKYFSLIWKDFITLRRAAVGLPIGIVIGFQRIIQISETALGTSALASADGYNSPRREAAIQILSTIITIFIAVIITSYIFTYGKYNLTGVNLSVNGFERISGYFKSVKEVTGYIGELVIMFFFIISGLTTILGSFHFVNKTINIKENKRIVLYITLISLSGMLSITDFNMIFDASDLLMFIVGSLNILAMLMFTIKNIKKYIS